MAFEMTLLKVYHTGTDEAKKLIPYIQRCGVYSPESAAMTEEMAEEAQNDWEKCFR